MVKKLRVVIEPEVYDFYETEAKKLGMSVSRYIGFLSNVIYIKTKEIEDAT